MNYFKKIEITAMALANESLKDIFPEIYELKKLIERNVWHRGETTFEHIVEVIENLEKLLPLEFIRDKKLKSKLLKRFISFMPKGAQKYNRKELLLLGALLHDIGKLQTYIINDDNTIRFPEHEEKGVEFAVNIAIRLEIKEQELSLIKDLVKYHAKPNYLSTSVRSKTPEEQTSAMRELIFFLGENAFEISLLALADFETSNTKHSDPDLFEFQQCYLTQFVLLASQLI